MRKKVDGSALPTPREGHAHRVRLPGFVGDEEIGLGDTVKRVASYFGARPCGGCEQRRTELNRWMTFGRGPRR
jgi:hypothetical protein